MKQIASVLLVTIMKQNDVLQELEAKLFWQQYPFEY